MDLSKIISISGKPGLFRLVSHVKGVFIVEDLEKGKKFSVYQQYKVSLLENIAMYTYEGEVPLKEVFKNIAILENYKSGINVKQNIDFLKEYTEKVLPNFDRERIYESDLKKLYKWYNILTDAKIITEENIKLMEEQQNNQPENNILEQE